MMPQTYIQHCGEHILLEALSQKVNNANLFLLHAIILHTPKKTTGHLLLLCVSNQKSNRYFPDTVTQVFIFEYATWTQVT